MYELVLVKAHGGLSCATQTAGMPCFVQYNGVFVNGEVLKVVRSCLSSVMMFGMCSTSLSKLVLAENVR